MKMNVFKYRFADNIYTKKNLAKYTWFGVGGNAELLYIPEEEISLEKIVNSSSELAVIKFVANLKWIKIVIKEKIVDYVIVTL